MKEAAPFSCKIACRQERMLCQKEGERLFETHCNQQRPLMLFYPQDPVTDSLAEAEVICASVQHGCFIAHLRIQLSAAMLIIDDALCDFEAEEKGSFCFQIEGFDFATKESFDHVKVQRKHHKTKPDGFLSFLSRMTSTFMAKMCILITEFNCQATASENMLTKRNQSRVMLVLPRFTSLEYLVHSLCVPRLLKTVLWMTDERRAAMSAAEPLVCWWSSSQIIWYWSPKIVSQHGLSWSQRSNTIRWFVSEETNDANRLVCLLQGHRLHRMPVGLFPPTSQKASTSCLNGYWKMIHQ